MDDGDSLIGARRRNVRSATRPFGGYEASRSSDVDVELTYADKGTPGGEYLRRFWQPVALTGDVGDLPLAVKIMGEDLVLFRTRSGELGLLHRQCSHRGASLEFGLISDKGIRCGYHGWHFAIDGRILDVPAETSPGSLAKRVCHGAYPVREYKGLVFAYLGPPDERPAFPIYDFMDATDEDCVPYCWPLDCNWLQVRENTQDPIHLTFLHSMFSIKQFGDLTPDLPYIKAYETPLGQITTSVRRLDDIYYVRVNEMIMPNVARVPDALRKGRAIPNNKAGAIGTGASDMGFEYQTLYPSSHGYGLSMWVVPNDDENSMFFGWHHVPNDEPEDVRNERVKQVAHGQINDRPYHERQRNPGDYDAITSQGKIVCRENDRLTSADVGVSLYRHQLRAGIRAVQAGTPPKGLEVIRNGTIPTYAYVIVRPAPPMGSAEEELQRKRDVEREVAEQVLAFRAENTPRRLVP
jgi:phenylpropionate dioxygenase-like ring-hydroxylating dioxygenase large terminal subunit